MWIQSVNKDDVERVWVNATNTSGATVTAHWPVFKFLNASCSFNEVTAVGAQYAPTGDNPAAAFVGLAHEDIPNGAVGVCQVYGYHESYLLAHFNEAADTIFPGMPLGPVHSLSVGLTSSLAIRNALNVPPYVVHLGSLTQAHSVTGVNYASHCFIRAL